MGRLPEYSLTISPGLCHLPALRLILGIAGVTRKHHLEETDHMRTRRLKRVSTQNQSVTSVWTPGGDFSIET